MKHMRFHIKHPNGKITIYTHHPEGYKRFCMNKIKDYSITQEMLVGLASLDHVNEVKVLNHGRSM